MLFWGARYIIVEGFHYRANLQCFVHNLSWWKEWSEKNNERESINNSMLDYGVPHFDPRPNALWVYFLANERTFSRTVDVNKESSVGDARYGLFCAWAKWPLIQSANNVFCVFNVRNPRPNASYNSPKNTRKLTKFNQRNGFSCWFHALKSPDSDLCIMAVRTVIPVMCTSVNW